MRNINKYIKTKIFIFNPYRLLNFSLLFNCHNIRYHFGPRTLLKKVFGYTLSYRILACFKNKKYSPYKTSSPLFFKHVEIETINRCNHYCRFCPVNVKDDPREYSEMPDSLFSKILDELSLLNFSGEITLYSNNEPLLDKKLVQRIREAREKCPHAFIYIITNGILLNFELITDILKAGIDKIVINNYNNKPVLNNNIKTIIDKLQAPEYRLFQNKIIIIKRKTDEILDNRAGLAPNKKKEEVRYYEYFHDCYCRYPFEYMVIRPDGKISLCCKDALGRKTLGDVTTQTLTEIWKGDLFNMIREKLLREGRKSIDVCSECDS